MDAPNLKPFTLLEQNATLKRNVETFGGSIFITDNRLELRNGSFYIEKSRDRTYYSEFFFSFTDRIATNPKTIQEDLLTFVEREKKLYEEALVIYLNDPSDADHQLVIENRELIARIVEIACEKFSNKSSLPTIIRDIPENTLKDPLNKFKSNPFVPQITELVYEGKNPPPHSVLGKELKLLDILRTKLCVVHSEFPTIIYQNPAFGQLLRLTDKARANGKL